MTKQEILDKMKMDLELRGRSPDTIHDYITHARIFQDHFNPAMSKNFAMHSEKSSQKSTNQRY